MMSVILTLTLFTLVCAVNVSGQNVSARRVWHEIEVQFQNHRLESWDFMLATGEGGLLIAATLSDNTGNSKAAILRISRRGTLLWATAMEGKWSIRKVILLRSGFWVLASGGDNGQAFLFNLDLTGNVRRGWRLQVGAGSIEVHDIEWAMAGDLMYLTGRLSREGEEVAWIGLFNPAENRFKWVKFFKASAGGLTPLDVELVRRNKTSLLYIAGTVYNALYRQDVFVARISPANQEIEWIEAYSLPACREYMVAMEQVRDTPAGLVIFGRAISREPVNGRRFFNFLMRLSLDGSVQQAVWIGDVFSEGSDIEVVDTGFYISGGCESVNGGTVSCWYWSDGTIFLSDLCNAASLVDCYPRDTTCAVAELGGGKGRLVRVSGSRIIKTCPADRVKISNKSVAFTGVLDFQDVLLMPSYVQDVEVQVVPAIPRLEKIDVVIRDPCKVSPDKKMGKAPAK